MSCKKQVKEDHSAFWMSCKIDGVHYSVESNEGRAINSNTYYYLNTTKDSISTTFYGYSLDSNDTFVTVTFRRSFPTILFDTSLYSPSFKSYNDFRSVFQLGVHPFVMLNSDDDGVLLYYQTDKGNTRLGTGNYDVNHSNFSNCNFEIFAVERYYSSKYKKDGVRVFANFDATLFEGQGDSIRIENAEFALLFVP